MLIFTKQLNHQWLIFATGGGYVSEPELSKVSVDYAFAILLVHQFTFKPNSG